MKLTTPPPGVAARYAFLWLAAFALAALAGCGAPSESEQNHGTNGPFTEEIVTLRDGSTVTCLTYDRALDCDWSTR